MTQDLRDQLMAAYGQERFTLTVEELEVRAGARRRRRSLRVALGAASALVLVTSAVVMFRSALGPLLGVGPDSAAASTVQCGVLPSAETDPGKKQTAVSTVTLGLYSGRPDPVWTLSAAEVSCLSAAIAALPIETGRVPDRGLGYHGFTIDSGGSSQIVWAGTVTIMGSAGDDVRSDPSCSVERFLLATGKPHLTTQEYEIVRQALNQGPRPACKIA